MLVLNLSRNRCGFFRENMSQYQADDAEYMADEYEMEDVDDDMDDEFRGREMGGSESDADEYDHLVCFSTQILGEITHTHTHEELWNACLCVYMYSFDKRRIFHLILF
jgi:hypothetical protein